MRLVLPNPAASLAAVCLLAGSAVAQGGASTQSGVLIGRVVRDDECTPVARAQVRTGSGLTAETDASGRFRLTGLASGTYSVVARALPYAHDTVTGVRIAPGGLGYAELRLRRSPGELRPSEDGLGPPPPAGGAVPERASAELGRDWVASTLPAEPRQGSVARLRLRARGAAAGADAPAARLGGERLHWRRLGANEYESLGAVPVDAPDSLPLVVTVRPATEAAAERRDTSWVAVARGDFPVERLRVAPEFGREPDLALAERLERVSEKARDVGCQAHLTPRLWRAPFLRPRPGRVTSAFGRAREYNGTVTGRHSGTDFAGAVGAPVYATNRGVVRLIDRFYLGGNIVYLDHGAGLVSAYLHLSATSVAVGDTVSRGQLVGRVGQTGRVTGPHLHWVVRYGKVSVDPMTLLAVTARPDAR